MIDKQLLDKLEYQEPGSCIEVNKAFGTCLLESI